MEVSGPGVFSKRTDQAATPITGLAYGQNKAINDIQAAAPLAGSANSVGPQAPQQPVMPPHATTSFDAPTTNPNEPVTSGADMGPGPGPAQQPTAYQKSASSFGPTLLPLLTVMASRTDAPQEVRDMLYTLRATMSQSGATSS